MVEAIFAVLGILGGVLGAVFYSRQVEKLPKVPETKPDIQLTDEERDALRKRIAQEQALVEQVRKGGDPDEILADLRARNDALNRRLDKYS